MSQIYIVKEKDFHFVIGKIAKSFLLNPFSTRSIESWQRRDGKRNPISSKNFNWKNCFIDEPQIHLKNAISEFRVREWDCAELMFTLVDEDAAERVVAESTATRTKAPQIFDNL